MWRPENRSGHGWESVDEWWAKTAILLQPFFWESLGKALGYGEKKSARLILQDAPTSKRGWNVNKEIGVGELLQHRLIDHLAEGQDAESYFAALLP